MVIVYSVTSDADAPFPVTSDIRKHRGNEAWESALGNAVAFRNAHPLSERKFEIVYQLGRAPRRFETSTDTANSSEFGAWGEATQAICFWQDGSIRDSRGRLLLNPETNEFDPAAQMPELTPGLARKRRTDAFLAERGLQSFIYLPAIEDASERLRSAADVARRCMALAVVVARGESVGAGRPIPAKDLLKRSPIAFTALSPLEAKFMNSGGWFKPPIERQAVIDATWRYEALAPLLWALGKIEMSPFPDKDSDFEGISTLMLESTGQDFIDRAELRPTAEILDMLDLQYRLHWIATEVRLGNRLPLGGAEPGIIRERHYALNWLTCYGDADWDDVSTDT